MEFAILFLIGLLIIIIYNLLNYIDMRFIQNEYKEYKTIIKDSIFILLSVLFGLFVYTNFEHVFIDFFSIIMNKSGKQIGTIMNKKPDIPVFTDSPGF
jgi:phosphotransferase system  glucose/maltose/N-acetylglucosamine-specific IIC component